MDENIMKTEAELKEEALEKFHTDEICLNCFCEDVFGNG